MNLSRRWTWVDFLISRSQTIVSVFLAERSLKTVNNSASCIKIVIYFRVLYLERTKRKSNVSRRSLHDP